MAMYVILSKLSPDAFEDPMNSGSSPTRWHPASASNARM
jgi:hypothetical protein